ncbi:hypothetical protein KAR04_04390 [Candidatus Calescamantes bacterium]|nr:hypothetical protein [Candidatus Calescamantes bacterium]MCK5599035.1 hypothetical protein [bacterium]
MKSAFLMIVILLFAVCTAAETNYTDLSKDHWAYGSVVRMTKFGLFKGIVKNGQLTFQGSKSLSRYEFSVAMDRLLNKIMDIQPEDSSSVDIDLSDENFKLQSNLVKELKNAMNNLQVKVNMNENSIQKTHVRVKELEKKVDSSSSKNNSSLFYLSVGSFVISIVALIFALG